MTALTAAETAAARRLIELALAEDLDAAGDRTSQATIPADLPGRAAFVARAARAVAAARATAPDLPVEVEVDTAEQFEAALACRPDVILLDNMPPDLMRQCVARRDAAGLSVLLEASGGVNLQTIGPIAATGVDR